MPFLLLWLNWPNSFDKFFGFVGISQQELIETRYAVRSLRCVKCAFDKVLFNFVDDVVYGRKLASSIASADIRHA